MTDETGRPYDRCEASLRIASSGEEFDLLALDSRRLEEGQFSLSFNVPGRWDDCYFAFSCNGAAEAVKSPVIRRGYKNPVDLGKLVLRGGEQ